MYNKLSLCFIVLILASVHGIPLINQDEVDAILADIDILLTILPTDGDKLYTPKNVEITCARMATECFMNEIKVLEDENKDNTNITDIIQRIQRNIHAAGREDLHNVIQENECPQCETYEAQHSEIFLKHLIEFLQSALYNRL